MSELLQIEQLRLSFAGVRALDGVSLSVRRGGLVAVIGPSGAGKTSLFNCISGLYRPEQGRIRLLGRDITRMPTHRIAALGVARTFQHPALFEGISVLENVLVGRRHHCRSGLLSNLLWLPGARRQEALHRRRADEIIELLHLGQHRKMPVRSLPYGVRKRVELARALCMEPVLLLLDEPTAGLNREEAAAMGRYLREVSKELGITQVLIAHELGFVLELAERVSVLDLGRVIAEGTPAQIRGNRAVIEAYIGHAGGLDSRGTKRGARTYDSAESVSDGVPASVFDNPNGLPERPSGEISAAPAAEASGSAKSKDTR